MFIMTVRPLFFLRFRQCARIAVKAVAFMTTGRDEGAGVPM
jgi:hypothetical protein